MTSLACISHTRLVATAFATPQRARRTRRWTSPPPGPGWHPDPPVSSHRVRTATSCFAALAAGDSAPAAALALCFAAVAWIAYREGVRRGSQSASEGARGANDGEANAAKPSGKGIRKESRSNNSHRSGAEETSPSPSPSGGTPSLTIEPIGTLHSIYRLCVGTPRQGMLAPHSRGVVTFDETKVSRDSLLELQNYSHVFVVFVFHLNSNGQVMNSNSDSGNGNSTGGDNGKKGEKRGKRQFTSKIAPPSLGGKKVGVFSTRTPHRPNPIGFSLCKLDEVVVHGKKRRKQIRQAGGGETFSLLLSGLDIVDGTPVLDVKPYVPHYDCVGYTPPSQSTTSLKIAMDATSLAAEAEDEGRSPSSVKVPHWVDSGLRKRRNVTFLPAADRFLQDLSRENEERSAASTSLARLQFYGPHSPWKDPPDQSVQHLKACIFELLGVDVRSAWQTKKARRGKFQAERSRRLKEWRDDGSDDANAKANDSVEREENGSANKFCTQQIDNLLVQFTIEEPGSTLYDESTRCKSLVDERSMGSGAEDIVVVHDISLIK